MPYTNLEQQFQEILTELPKSKLQTIFDFARYLRDRETSDELFTIQMRSHAYQEWLSVENDIYDEVFNNEIA